MNNADFRNRLQLLKGNPAPVILILSIATTVFLQVVKLTTGLHVLYFIQLVLVSIGLSVLITPLLENVLPRILRHERISRLIIPMTAIAFTVTICTMSIAKYASYSVGMFDIGLIDQAVWNTVHGRLMEVTNIHYPYGNSSFLGTHFEIITSILSLAYTVFASPYLLIIIQSVLVGGSIILCNKIADRILGNRMQAVSITLLWALYTPLHFAALFDVHADLCVVFFIMAAYYSFLTGRHLLFWLSTLAALFCKEYAAFAMMGLGFALIAVHGKKRLGGVTVLASVLYLAAVYYGAMPLFRPAGDPDILAIHYGAFQGAGGARSIAAALVSDPALLLSSMFTSRNGEQMFYLIFPMSVLPFLSPWFLVSAIPVLAGNLLIGMDIWNHRLASVLPLFLFAAINGLKRIGAPKVTQSGRFGQTTPGFFLALCVSSTLIACFIYGPTPAGHRFWRELQLYVQTPRDHVKDLVIKGIPADIPVSASEHLAPHLAHRRFCYVFPRPIDPATGALLHPVQVVVLDTIEDREFLGVPTGSDRNYLAALDKLGFAIIDSKDGILTFRMR